MPELRRVRTPGRISAVRDALVFSGSPERSLGMELEFQLVDERTWDLVPAAPAILTAAAAIPELEGRAHKELMQNTVELVTGARADGSIPTQVRELVADMEVSISTVSQLAHNEGALLVLSGSHPFADPAAQDYTADPRILALVNDLGKPARDLQTYGLHVHVGVPDGDAAIRAMNHLNRYLAHFLALSASSPYWGGEDTRLASYRSPAFEAMPLTGPPPTMRTWRDYTDRYRMLIAHHRVADGGRDDPWAGNKDIHWDVRPSPRFGTIELRICDATPTVREAAAIAALAQCLVDEAVRQRKPPFLLDDFTIRDNKDRAARYGLDSEVAVPGRQSPLSVRTDIERTLKRLEPTAMRLGCLYELRDVATILETGPSADRQRRVYAASVAASGKPAPVAPAMTHDGARAVVRSLADELTANRASQPQRGRAVGE